MPLSEAEKGLISQRKEQGNSLQKIAEELACAYETVRKWWHCQRDHRALRQRGRPKQGVLSTFPAQVIAEAIAIKQAHPHWGPPNVKVELRKRLSEPGLDLPSDARLSVLFKMECPQAVQSRVRRAYPEKSSGQVRQPHIRWQIDAKEAVRIGENDFANILDVRDPAGALMIASQAFLTTSKKHWRELTMTEIQNTLRQAFHTWGKPLEIQTDRETVYVGSSDHNFPSPFTLWLVGLGIKHIVSRSHRPTDQAQVERNHRTLADMAWIDQHYDHLSQLQAALDDHCQRYNECLPVEAAGCHGQPPLAVHPEARFSGRPYHLALEWQQFDMRRVDQYLSQYVWVRQVTGNGVVSFGAQHYYVGRAYIGQRISGQFIPETRSFRFQTADGTLIRELPAKRLDKGDILGFIPVEETLPVGYQFPLPFVGV
jgi:transposase-like protein